MTKEEILAQAAARRARTTGAVSAMWKLLQRNGNIVSPRETGDFEVTVPAHELIALLDDYVAVTSEYSAMLWRAAHPAKYAREEVVQQPPWMPDPLKAKGNTQ